MNEQTTKAMIEAGAIKKVMVIAQGSQFHLEFKTPNGNQVLTTLKGSLKTWKSVDSILKWLKGVGIGFATIEFSKWQFGQRNLNL
jgi:hypothetical protein